MAKLLKLENPEMDGDQSLVEIEAAPPIAPSPIWEHFKHDPRWLTDRWVMRNAIAEKRAFKPRGRGRLR